MIPHSGTSSRWCLFVNLNMISDSVKRVINMIYVKVKQKLSNKVLNKGVGRPT